MKVVFSKKADRQLLKLNSFVKNKIIKVISKFEKGERVDIKRILQKPGKISKGTLKEFGTQSALRKMRGKDEEFRIRVGNYRVLIKKFQNNDYLVTELGKRENIYFFGFSV